MNSECAAGFKIKSSIKNVLYVFLYAYSNELLRSEEMIHCLKFGYSFQTKDDTKMAMVKLNSQQEKEDSNVETATL